MLRLGALYALHCGFALTTCQETPELLAFSGGAAVCGHAPSFCLFRLLSFLFSACELVALSGAKGGHLPPFYCFEAVSVQVSCEPVPVGGWAAGRAPAMCFSFALGFVHFLSAAHLRP